MVGSEDYTRTVLFVFRESWTPCGEVRRLRENRRRARVNRERRARVGHQRSCPVVRGYLRRECDSLFLQVRERRYIGRAELLDHTLRVVEEIDMIFLIFEDLFEEVLRHVVFFGCAHGGCIVVHRHRL